jgi:hypothetical protein
MGTPGNMDDSGSEDDDFKPQQSGKGKQAIQGSKAGGSGGGGGASGGADTDLHALDDAVGIAGVDLNVGIQGIHATLLAGQQQQQAGADR